MAKLTGHDRGVRRPCPNCGEIGHYRQTCGVSSSERHHKRIRHIGVRGDRLTGIPDLGWVLFPEQIQRLMTAMEQSLTSDQRARLEQVREQRKRAA